MAFKLMKSRKSLIVASMHNPSIHPHLHGPHLKPRAEERTYLTRQSQSCIAQYQGTARYCVLCTHSSVRSGSTPHVHEHTRNQPSPVTNSYSRHTVATPTHTLMHTPHPPTHSVAPFNHVRTRAACRGALVGATSATATWVDAHVRFGLVSHSL